jgi:hypothetical protein
MEFVKKFLKKAWRQESGERSLEQRAWGIGKEKFRIAELGYEMWNGGCEMWDV